MNTWIKKDLRYIWHPYTQMKDAEKFPPVLIERSRGLKLYEASGKWYYDTISSWWCNVHGHNHPAIKAAIKQQLGRLDHVLFAGFTHQPAISLAEQLVALTPRNLTKVFYSDNGSTAVEIALKMSFQYWQNTGRKNKTKFVCLDYAYHGDTIGAMSVSGVGLFNGLFSPLFFSSLTAPAPYCYRCLQGKQKDSCALECADRLEEIFKDKDEEIAALILEPLVLAAGGMIIYPAAYLRRAGELCKKYNVHLILDEAATGFGRTGKMFACEYTDVLPDFMCLAKGITSGTLPLAVTLTTDKVYQAFYADYEQQKTFYHGHTYTANSLACAAAMASCALFSSEKTLERMQESARLLHQGLEKFRDLPLVGDVRYIGLIGALELVKDRKTKASFGLKERIGARIYTEGLKERIILRPLGNVIYLYLPLCIREREVAAILKKTSKVIQRVVGDFPLDSKNMQSV